MIGRETEIAEAWRTLESQSIVLTSERRIGKTCLLRKMIADPPEGWLPLMCWVESKRHPNEVVQDLYEEAENLGLRSGREVWSRRLRTAYEAASGANFGNWHLPQFQPDWKRLCNTLFDDLADTDQRVLIVMDEFPHLVANMMADDPVTAMEFLDLMREVRQRLEPAGGIRFVFAGSVGLHLIVQQLKTVHGYKSNPTNDMAVVPLSGMSPEDTTSMCRAFLDEEGIRREPAADFDRRMFEATDGLPIYIQFVCQKFQTARPQSVAPSDIDEVLDDMLDGSEVEWFADSAKRIETHYRDLEADLIAFAALDLGPVFAGSVGLHLIVQQLKTVHGYKSNPTNDMAVVPLSGMSPEDTTSMCRAFLDEEGIRREPAADFDRRMFEATDGLPIYIQFVCQKFQTARPQSVAPSDIDEVLDDMLDGSEVEWFADSAKRIETHYRDLEADLIAFAALDLLCRDTRLVPESEIADFVRSQTEVEDDRATLSALELLQKDQYIARDTSDGVRRYRFKYELMRRWWDKNKGSA